MAVAAYKQVGLPMVGLQPAAYSETSAAERSTAKDPAMTDFAGAAKGHSSHWSFFAAVAAVAACNPSAGPFVVAVVACNPSAGPFVVAVVACNPSAGPFVACNPSAGPFVAAVAVISAVAASPECAVADTCSSSAVETLDIARFGSVQAFESSSSLPGL